MGTTWSARIVGDAASIAPDIQRALDRVVAQMSHWEQRSDLSRFNQSEPGRWQPLKPEFRTVLTAALALAQKSDGAFDPAMGALVDLWGFGPPGPMPVPSDADIASDFSEAGYHQVELDDARARRLSLARLDLSGIAKGYGVDAAAERIRGAGFPDFLIEVGGELRGEGIKPDGQPWWIDLEAVAGSRLAPLRVALHGLSVATSGDYRRSFMQDGKRYAHTIDPRTGRPLENGVASVTVLHASCMYADGWATALSVLGAKGMALAEREGQLAHMVVREGTGFSEYISPALQSLIAG